jgi:O-antigen/teichoic acid export membrane protein
MAKALEFVQALPDPSCERDTWAASVTRANGKDGLLRPALALIAGRCAAYAVAFILPVVLARFLTPAQFGAYKQLFLILAVLATLAEFGMSESLYYFVPSRPDRAPSLAANAMISLAASGLACLTLIVWARAAIARFFGSAELEGLLIPLGVYLTLTLAATPLEVLLIARGHHHWAAGAYATSGIARSLLTLIPALLWGSLGALVAGNIVFAALRVAVTLSFLERELGRELRPSFSLLVMQLRYALPLQAAVALEVLQSHVHYLAVARRCDASTFALYAVGCLQIPLVDVISRSLCNVMMVKMAQRRQDRRQLSDLWLHTTWRLGLILMPVIGALIVVSIDLIPLLFTDTYRASVPIFRMWMAVQLLAILQPHGVLRVLGATRFMAAQNFLKLVLVLASVNMLIDRWGLGGGVLVIAMAGTVGKALSLMRLSQLGAISLVDLLPWRSLMTTATATVIAGLLASAVRGMLGPSHLVGLIVALTVFGASYGAMALWAGAHHAVARPVQRRHESANGKSSASHQRGDSGRTSVTLADPRPQGT